jgi:hypothetical protein
MSLVGNPETHGDADPGSERPRCGGRESDFLAVLLEAMGVTLASLEPKPGNN